MFTVYRLAVTSAAHAQQHVHWKTARAEEVVLEVRVSQQRKLTVKAVAPERVPEQRGIQPMSETVSAAKESIHTARQFAHGKVAVYRKLTESAVLRPNELYPRQLGGTETF